MAIFINLIIIVIYLIGIAWMWQNLEDLEKTKSNCYINRINANVYSNKYYICNL